MLIITCQQAFSGTIPENSAPVFRRHGVAGVPSGVRPGHWWHHLGPLSTSVSGQGRSGTHFLLLSFRVSGSLRFATHLVNAICVRGCSGAQLSAAQSEQIWVASYDAIPDHAPFYTIWFHTISCHVVWYSMIPYYTTPPYQTTSRYSIL